MASVFTDPFTGEVRFKDPNQVINETTGQTAGTITGPTTEITQDTSTASPELTALSKSLAPQPTGFSVGEISPDISSDVITSATSQPTSSFDLTSQINTYFEQQQKLQEDLLREQTIGNDRVTRAQQDLDTILSQERDLLDFSEDRKVDIGTIRGEQAQTQREFSRRKEAATAVLQLEVNRRAQKIDEITQVMEFNQDNLSMFQQLSESTRPDIIEADIDPATGEVYALIQDPMTGQVTQQVVGQVTPDLAASTGLEFLAKGTYTNGSNQQVFWGVTPQGEIVQQILGTAKQTKSLTEELAGLLSPTEAQLFGVPFGTTKEGVVGFSALSASQRQAASAFASAREIITTIENTADNLITATNAVEAAAQAASIGGKILARDANAVLFKEQKKGLMSLLVRALGEKGVLTNTDIDRVRGLLPSIYDTVEIKNRKLNDLRNFIDGVEKTTLTSLTSPIQGGQFVNSEQGGTVDLGDLDFSL